MRLLLATTNRHKAREIAAILAPYGIEVEVPPALPPVVSELDASGTATFTTVFPGCYDGRWPHIHFEVYSSLADATTSGPIVKTSQLAMPKETCEAVYAASGYESSAQNLSRTSLARDLVFGDDGGIHQLASISGSAGSALAASLTIGV